MPGTEGAPQAGDASAAAYRLVRGTEDRALVFPADEVDEPDHVELGATTLEGLLELAGSRPELAVLSLETERGGQVRPMSYEPARDGRPVRMELQLERHRLSVSVDGTIVARPKLGPEDLRTVERWLDRARAVG